MSVFTFNVLRVFVDQLKKLAFAQNCLASRHFFVFLCLVALDAFGFAHGLHIMELLFWFNSG